MPGKNMFAAFASDSEEDEYKTVESKKHTKKDKPATKEKDETKEVVGTRRAEEGDYSNVTRKPRGRGRGRGRGEYRGGYGEHRGGYRGRGYGERGYRGGRRGRGDRGGRRGRGRGGYYGREDGPRETYSHLATKEQVTGKADDNTHHEEEEVEEGHQRMYERRSGTGHGKEIKKGGAGKGGWGNPDEDHKYEHMKADEAAQLANEEAKEEKPAEAYEEQKEEGEGEEEVNNLTYKEYMAQKKEQQEELKKGTSRKPDEIKVKNIQKYNKDDTSVKQVKSYIKGHEAYATGGISADVEVGFQPIGDEPEEIYERPRGRGRGRGRGGYRGAPRGGHEGQHGGRKFHNKKFNAQDEDFPPL